MAQETRKRAQKAESRRPRTRKPVEAPNVAPEASSDFAFGDEGTPDRTGSSVTGRITLPPSGLASDILAREDAQAVAPSGPGEIAPVPPAPVARPEGLSFLMAPAREEKKPVEATEHLVTFFLGEEEYGLDVRLVQEIIRLTEITPVPRAPEFVQGVINLRGRIIPVVDLKKKLKLGEVDASVRAARIVVAKLRDRLVGLLVDGASQVLKIPVSLIEPPPEEVVEVEVDYIRGVAKLEGRLVILMDLTRVLGLEPQGAPGSLG
jgi:purine-binding chemotaxis protein CheW